ncbi:MAG: hypothetical protein GX116_06045 [Fibrobacter sp.]|nr:hypothetical protein [Fibrobacter sp.]
MVHRKIQQTTDAPTQSIFQGLWFLSFLFFFLLFVSCTASKWSVAHPSYQKKITKNDSIAVIGLENAFILTREKWFANRLSLPPDSIHAIIDPWMSKTFYAELHNLFPNSLLLPDSLQSSWPEESFQLDHSIFLKGKFPEQGSVVSTDSINPPYLLLLHEFIIGTDLSRAYYFDYELHSQNTQIQSEVKSVSFIASYTLWDNQKQRPLVSSIIEWQEPYTHSLSFEQLQKNIKNLVLAMQKEMAAGDF